MCIYIVAFQANTTGTSTSLVGEVGCVAIDDTQRTLLEGALRRIKEQVDKKRILVKPVFQDFDRYNIAYMYMYMYIAYFMYGKTFSIFVTE